MVTMAKVLGQGCSMGFRRASRFGILYGDSSIEGMITEAMTKCKSGLVFSS